MLPKARPPWRPAFAKNKVLRLGVAGARGGHDCAWGFRSKGRWKMVDTHSQNGNMIILTNCTGWDGAPKIAKLPYKWLNHGLW
jgi:hypothetical protein